MHYHIVHLLTTPHPLPPQNALYTCVQYLIPTMYKAYDLDPYLALPLAPKLIRLLARTHLARRVHSQVTGLFINLPVNHLTGIANNYIKAKDIWINAEDWFMQPWPKAWRALDDTEHQIPQYL